MYFEVGEAHSRRNLLLKCRQKLGTAIKSFLFPKRTKIVACELSAYAHLYVPHFLLPFINFFFVLQYTLGTAVPCTVGSRHFRCCKSAVRAANATKASAAISKHLVVELAAITVRAPASKEHPHNSFTLASYRELGGKRKLLVDPFVVFFCNAFKNVDFDRNTE